MNLKKEILEYFASTSGDGAYELKGLGEEYKAWVIKYSPFYGVAFEYNGKEFNESFTSINLQKMRVMIDGRDTDILYLRSTDFDKRETFATVCADFVEPGEKGYKRESTREYPFDWWEMWKELLGNARNDKMVYDVVGELMALCKLLKQNENLVWAAVEQGSHDIEAKDCSYEIKSTIHKEGAFIHVSSQFQLDADKPLYLIFNRLEKSIHGESINSLMQKVRELDPDKYSAYESYLSTIGFPKGSHYREMMFKLLERRKYDIDDSFPKIVAESFKDNKFPNEIAHIEYDVNLDGLSFINWNL